MKRIAFLIIALITIHIGYSQEFASDGAENSYQTYFSNKTYYYGDGKNPVKCVRIDSVNFDTDSVFYSFNTLNYIGQTVGQTGHYVDKYSSTVSSWIGKKIIVKSNGDNIFFNASNDTILIKTKAKLGDKWVLWYNESFHIEAEVTGYKLENILGLNDSVKTITLKGYELTGSEVEFYVCRYPIKLSKSFGLIETPNIFHFPNVLDKTYDNVLETYNLIGVSSPKLGFQNLTSKEIFDFQPGDEFHRKEYNTSGMGYGYEQKSITKYLSRTEQGSSIEYEYSIDWNHKSFNYGEIGYTLTKNTFKRVLTDPIIDLLSGESLKGDYGLPVFSMNYDQPDTKYFNNIDLRWNNDEKIWTDDLISDNGAGYHFYRRGLGGFYTISYDIWGMGMSYDTLVYYKVSIRATPYCKCKINSGTYAFT